MCLFLLAVRNAPDKQNLFGLSGSAGGVCCGYCVLCFFTHLCRVFSLIIWQNFFFWFSLFMIADGKLLFLCPSLLVPLFKGVSDVPPSPCPDIIQARCCCQGAGDILDILSLVGAMSPAQHFLASKQIYLSFKCKIKMTLFF